MPKGRKDCEWARPNCSHDYEPPNDAANKMVCLYRTALDQQSFSPLSKLIDESATVDDLITKAAPERCLAWNLQNIRIKCKIVEFRRPPQSRNEGECKHWVVFALSLVHWALTADFSIEPALENPREFEATIQQVAESLGIVDNLISFGEMKRYEEKPMSVRARLRTMKKKMEK